MSALAIHDLAIERVRSFAGLQIHLVVNSPFECFNEFPYTGTVIGKQIRVDSMLFSIDIPNLGDMVLLWKGTEI